MGYPAVFSGTACGLPIAHDDAHENLDLDSSSSALGALGNVAAAGSRKGQLSAKAAQRLHKLDAGPGIVGHLTGTHFAAVTIASSTKVVDLNSGEAIPRATLDLPKKGTYFELESGSTGPGDSHWPLVRLVDQRKSILFEVDGRRVPKFAQPTR